MNSDGEKKVPSYCLNELSYWYNYPQKHKASVILGKKKGRYICLIIRTWNLWKIILISHKSSDFMFSGQSLFMACSQKLKNTYVSNVKTILPFLWSFTVYKHTINLLLSIISITNVLAHLLVFILEYKS